MTDRYIFQIQKLAREWADLATSLHIQKNEAINNSICYLISVRRFPNGNRSWSARGLGERVYVSVRLLFSPLCPAEWPQCFNRWSGVIQWCHHGIFACYIKDDLMMLGVHMACVCGLCLCLLLYLFPDRISSAGSSRACVDDSDGSISQTCVSCILLCPPSLWKRGTCFRTAEEPWQLQTVSHIPVMDNSLS